MEYNLCFDIFDVEILMLLKKILYFWIKLEILVIGIGKKRSRIKYYLGFYV